MVDFFVQNARATEASPPQGSLAGIIPLIILFVVFWFFLIRPQMKQAKEHKAMIAALVKGDEVVTAGGLLGKIKELGDNFVVLEIAKEIQVKVQRNSISMTLPKGSIKTL